MRRLFLIFPLLVWVGLRAEIVDRIAITVASKVITELQLDEELRVTAFLNGKSIVRSLDARRNAADRMVEQLLIRREMELSHYPLPNPQEVNTYLDQVRSQFGGGVKLDQALKTYYLSEDVLREHLALQLTTLRFIEYRFSSDLSVSEEDVKASYRRESAEAAQAGSELPAFDQVKESIRQSLIQERTDEALDNWLEEVRKQVNIIYLDKALE